MQWFEEVKALYGSSSLSSNVLSTLILLLAYFVLRLMLVRAIQSWPIPNVDVRRKWVVQAKNLAILILFLGTIFIWGSELKTFAVSLVAIAAAVVIALKELLLCVLGGILKAGTQMFSIGDRIEVAGLRGDVITHNLLTTTVFEIGPGREFHQFTGRVAVIPNSMFLSQSVINETETGPYVLHVVRIPYHRQGDWPAARQKLLQVAIEVCKPYIDDARRQFSRLGRKEGIEPPRVEPRVSIAFQDPERVDLLLRLPTPANQRGRIEQAILCQFSGIQD